MSIYRLHTSKYKNILEQYNELHSKLKESDYFFYREDNSLVAYEYLNNYDQSEQMHTVNFKVMDEFMGESSSELLSNFLHDLNPLFGEYLKENNKSYQSFMEKVMKFMFLFADYNYGSLESGMLSYCSHSEGYFTNFEDRERVKSNFENNFKANSPKMLKLLNDCLKANRSNSFSVLKNAIASTQLEVKSKIKKGDIKFLNLDHNLIKGDQDLLNSPFHKKITESQKVLKYMSSNIDFLTKRFLTILQYMFLKNAGLTHKERYYFCYLVYRTIEEKLDVNSLNEIEKWGDLV